MPSHDEQRSRAAIRSATARRVKKVIGMVDDLADQDRFELNNGEVWGLLSSVRYLAANAGTDPLTEEWYERHVEHKQWLAERKAEAEAEADDIASDWDTTE